MSFYTNSAALWPWCQSSVCSQAAGSVHLDREAVSSPINQRVLNSEYVATATSLHCASLSSVSAEEQIPAPPFGIEFGGVSSGKALSFRVKAMRIAVALDGLAHAEAAFDNTTVAAGGAPASEMTGEGKSFIFAQLIGRLRRVGFAYRPSDVADVQRIVQNAFGTALSSCPSPLEFLIQQFRGALGLNRASSRNLRSELLRLVGLRCLVFAWHRDRLDGVDSKGRVYLRTALTGASSRNAPPAAAVVRRSGTTGTRDLPPMHLVA